MKLVLEEDRAHQDWVENQEKVWKESKEKDVPMPAKKEAAVTWPHLFRVRRCTMSCP